MVKHATSQLGSEFCVILELRYIVCLAMTFRPEGVRTWIIKALILKRQVSNSRFLMIFYVIPVPNYFFIFAFVL